MLLKILAIFCASTLAICWAYQIPNVKLENLKEGGFRVSIPNEPGIESVLYLIEINKRSPAIMDYITKASGNSWQTKSSDNLMPNDKLIITLLVQHNKNIFKSTENMISGGAMSTKKKIKTVNIHEKCPLLINNIPLDDCTSCQTSTSDGKTLCPNDLLFSEDFSSGFDQWTHYANIAPYPYEFVHFNAEPQHSFIKDGYLHIKPALTTLDMRKDVIDLGNKCLHLYNQNECKVKPNWAEKIFLNPVHSAQIRTKNFSFKYGRVEITAKLPKGDWVFPYIMLRSEENPYQQIRIAFARGNDELRTPNGDDVGGRTLYGGFVELPHVNKVENDAKYDYEQKHLTAFKGENHFGDDFHNYTLEWTQQAIKFGIDGFDYLVSSNLNRYLKGKFHISLGVSAGGFFEFHGLGYQKDLKDPKKWETDRSAYAAMKEQFSYIKKFNDEDRRSPHWFHHYYKKYNQWKVNEMLVDSVRVYAV